MDIKKHITVLGFVPKNGTNGIYHKMYLDYAIEIDFEKKKISLQQSNQQRTSIWRWIGKRFKTS